MALRNYKSYTYYDENGNAHDTLMTTDIKGMYITDMRIADSAPINRRICCCGNVDAPTREDMNTPCPRCGNTSFEVPGGNNYYWTRKYAHRNFNVDNVFIINNEVYYQSYVVEFLPISKSIKIQQIHQCCASIGKRNNIPGYVDCSVPTGVSINKILEQVQVLLFDNTVMKTVIALCEQNKGDDANPVINGHCASTVLSLYNMVTIAPFMQSMDFDSIIKLKKTWFNKLHAADLKIYRSFLEIENRNKLSVSLRDMIPVLGIIENTQHLDNLNDGMINALKYAIMHRYIDSDDIKKLLKNEGSIIDKINEWGPGFTDFFRRNVVLYGRETIEAYEHLLMTGASNMKEDTLIRLEAYLEKKKYKDNQIKKFEEEFLNGDPIAAMKALVS